MEAIHLCNITCATSRVQRHPLIIPRPHSPPPPSSLSLPPLRSSSDHGSAAMFEAEARGLEAMHAVGAIKVPRPLKVPLSHPLSYPSHTPSYPSHTPLTPRHTPLITLSHPLHAPLITLSYLSHTPLIHLSYTSHTPLIPPSNPSRMPLVRLSS